jgi:hypothetical protein
MVDALREAHRVLRPRGLLIDVRPDGERLARLEAGRRVRGYLRQGPGATADDRGADAAVATVLERGLFRPRESGWLWHRSTLGDLDELREYTRTSPRYSGLAPGTLQALRPYRRGPILMRRAIKYAVLERLPNTAG